MVSGTGIGIHHGAVGGTVPLGFDDNVKLTFGDDDDSAIYFDNTDTFWDLQAVGTGALMLALGDCFPSPDGNAVHIWEGSAGTITANASSLLIVEAAEQVGISLLSPNNVASFYAFGEPSGNLRSRILYRGSTDTPADTLDFSTASVSRLQYSAAAFAFQEATLVDVSTGTLDLGFSGTSRIGIDTNGLGFFATTPAAQPTGVAVSAAGIHAALVTLGLITA